jgi:hypothetical protein
MPATRTVLTPLAAMEIFVTFQHRRQGAAQKRPYSIGLSAHLAKKFKVTQRAIRDVWNGMSWASFTAAMYSSVDSGDATDMYWLLLYSHDA